MVYIPDSLLFQYLCLLFSLLDGYQHQHRIYLHTEGLISVAGVPPNQRVQGKSGCFIFNQGKSGEKKEFLGKRKSGNCKVSSFFTSEWQHSLYSTMHPVECGS